MYLSDSMGSWPALRAARSGGRTAVVSGDERLTYAQLDARAARVAGALRAEGVEAGDRVACILRNRHELLEMLFGVTRLGAVFVPINFRLAAPEIAYVLHDSGTRVLVGQHAFEDEARRACAEAGATYRSVDGPVAEYVPWRDRAECLAPVATGRDDVAMIMYTSGTTGPPKGAVITHENVLYNLLQYTGDWDLRADDVTVVVNPIFHAVLHILTVPLLYKGGTVVLQENFDPQETLRIVRDEGVTVMFAIPAAWEMLVDAPDFESTDFSALRFAGSGGAAAPPRLMQMFARRDIPYRQGYGLTETTSSATVMDAADQARKPGSIGRPFFGVEVTVVADDGRDCGPGEVGELLLRGRNIARGYWNKPAETADSFMDDGWFRTGDLARRDDEGFLFLVDRKKDVIISGGENIASIEVEHAILQHEAIQEAAVIGLPHERWGETPRAIVALRDGAALDEAGLIAHCRSLIAGYKCPTSVVFVDQLPKTANGKIAKAQLREQYGAGAVAASLEGIR
jgi:fatty-acyl-CoA synthase